MSAQAIRHRVAGYSLACVFAVAIAAPTLARGISVSPGARFSVGEGSVRLGCGDLDIGGVFSVDAGSVSGIRDVSINPGTLNGGSGLISLSGDWANAGTFNAQSGTVAIVDGCGSADSTLSGDSTFSGLSVSSSSGRTLLLESGSSQTVAGSLALAGTPATRLVILPETSGAVARLTLASGASQAISAVDVQDIDASGGEVIAPGSPESFDSIDRGNNLNWFIASVLQAVPVHTLPLPALFLLALLMTTLTRTALPGRTRP